MYYNWQECNEAYEKKNQYLFGTSLMVAPITAPRIEKNKYGESTGMAAKRTLV